MGDSHPSLIVLKHSKNLGSLFCYNHNDKFRDDIFSFMIELRWTQVWTFVMLRSHGYWSHSTKMDKKAKTTCWCGWTWARDKKFDWIQIITVRRRCSLFTCILEHPNLTHIEDRSDSQAIKYQSFCSLPFWQYLF